MRYNEIIIAGSDWKAGRFEGSRSELSEYIREELGGSAWFVMRKDEKTVKDGATRRFLARLLGTGRAPARKVQECDPTGHLLITDPGDAQ